jgi:hypothetical protein
MLTLEIGRVVRARPAVVFRAFSDADELAKWWGPRGFSTPSLELHARVGAGSFDKLERNLCAAPSSHQARAKGMQALEPDPPLHSVSKPAEAHHGTTP